MDSKSTGWPAAVALFILFADAAFIWQATRVWLAEEYAGSANLELRRRATSLAPEDAATWAMLGSMEEWELGPGALERAAADYERAAVINPHSDRNWLELAEIYERLGKISQARAAYEQAQSAHPISSTAAWNYGNFLLRQGEALEACRQFHGALGVDPRLTEAAATAWWKSELYRTEPISGMLPAQNSYYFAALDYFVRQNEPDLELRVWNELLDLHQRFELSPSLGFVNSLIAAGRVADAQHAWRQALEVSAWPHDDAGGESLVFNGSFEQDPADGGFDWRLHPVPGVSTAFDDAAPHSGKRSLRISFDGSANFDFHDIAQYVAVDPLRRLRLAAYARAEGLTTDSGIHISVEDPARAGLTLAATPSATGTTPWARAEAEFTTGGSTEMVRIVVRREPSSRLDNKLRGTVWLDDVSLTAVDTGSPGHSP